MDLLDYEGLLRYDELIKRDISDKVSKTTTINGYSLDDNVIITKSDLELENVGNFKAVSTVASQGLADTEKANARDNIAAQHLIGIGTSNTAATTAIKKVSIPSITSLNVGLIIIVTPTVTATSADNSKIKLNAFDAYPIHFNGSSLSSTTDGMVWVAGYPSTFMFDGSSWECISSLRYATMTTEQGIAGTITVPRVITPASLKLIIDARGYTSNEGTITGITMNGESVGTSGVVDLGTVITDVSDKVDNTTTVNGHALSSDVTITKSDVGLSNVTNDAQVKRSEMGVASGVATLDSAGKVPSSQLPSYVDDVLEYDTKPDFPTTGEAGKIYVDKSTNTTWRWSGSAYTQIKGDLAIGTTTGTAADGGVANTHYNNTSNPHSVTKAQVGLGSVVNTGDSATPVSGGTTKFTTGGAYTELNKKVDKVSGKGLSTNDYTDDEKTKLAGIASGAEVNVQSDWNATDGDAFIKNKPTIPAAQVNSDWNATSGVAQILNKPTIPDSFQWYGTSSTAAATVQKEVSIPSITTLNTGQIIVVNPTVTSTVANSTLKLNSFDAYPMMYNNAAITTSTDSIVWRANIPSLFVFNGSYWVFLGHGLDLNTEYSAMSVAEGTAGTKTTLRTMRADYLKQIIQALAPQSDWDATSGNAVILNKPTIPAEAANGTYTVKTLVGSTTTDVSDFTANQSSADDVTFVQGSNVTLTTDTTNRTITVSATDTWTAASTSAAGYVPAATAGKYLHSNASTGALEWVDDRYVNSASFAHDSTNNNVKMTLTRAGSDSATVTGNIPLVSSSSAGVAPKGAAVSSQSQSTKFLREDGSWAAPSYTTNTTYKINLNGTDTGGGSTSLGTIYGATTAGTSGQYLKSSGSGAPTWANMPTSLPASDVYSWAKAADKPSYAYSEIGYTVSTTSSAGGTLSLAGTTPLHVITLTGNVSALTLSANPAEGHSCHVILTAASAQTVVIAHDSTNRVCPGAEDISLDIPAGGYVEIDFLTANSKVYVRGV